MTIRLPRWPALPPLGRDAWLVNAATACCAGAYLGMAQLLLVLYVLRLGFGPAFVGTLFAVGALSYMAASVPSGALGGRYGPRRMMRAGALLTALGMAMLPCAELVPGAWRAAWPLITQCVSSCGWSLFTVNQIAAIMAFTTVTNRRNAYALKEAAAGLGMFLGALVGGLLPGLFSAWLRVGTHSPVPYRYGLWVSVAMACAASVPLLFVAPVPAIARQRDRRAQRPPFRALIVLAACGLLNNGAVASCKAFASAYMDRVFGLPAWLIGAATSIGMFLAIVGALGSPRLARRRGSEFAMLLASASLGGGLLLMGVWPNAFTAQLGAISTLSLSAVFVPSYQVLQMEAVAPEWRSLVAGVGSMAMSLGYGTVSLTGGYIVSSQGYARLFQLGACLALLSAVLMWRLVRRPGFRVAAAQVPGGSLSVVDVAPGAQGRSDVD